MKDSERADFARLLIGVGELYGKKMSSMLMNIYWAALKRFDLVAIRQSINRHVNSVDIGQFMPKPADVIRHLEGDSDTHALKAWSKVESAIRKIGGYNTVIFDDPLISVVVRSMGGWPRLCGMLTKDMPLRAGEFMRRYQRCYENRKKPNPLPEQVNKTLRGTFPNSSPVLIRGPQLEVRMISNDVSSPKIAILHSTRIDCDLSNQRSSTEQPTCTKKAFNVKKDEEINHD